MCAEKSECSRNYTCAGDIIKGERRSEGGVETASVWVKDRAWQAGGSGRTGHLLHLVCHWLGGG